MTQTTAKTSTTEAKKKKPSEVYLEGVRLCFVHLHAPQTQTGDDGATRETYGVRVLVPQKRTDQLGILKAAVIAAKVGAGRPIDEKYRNAAVRNGDADTATEGKPEFKGMMFLNARTNSRPICLTRANVALENPEAIKKEFYSGCIADVFLNAYYYAPGPKTKGNKGVTWGLSIVRKRGDAPRLDGRATVADMPPVSMDDEGAIYADFGLEPQAGAEPKGGNLSDDDPF